MSNVVKVAIMLIAIAILSGAAILGISAFGGSDSGVSSGDAGVATNTVTASPEPEVPSIPESSFDGSYELEDDKYGTMTTVFVDENTRTIISNALPNHDTGDFPGEGNPNTISAQDAAYSFDLIPEFTGDAKFARTPGVAVNGVKFEPQTAERLNCETGEEYNVEAIQDFLNLGLDFNNAHVQPTGAYHYHGVADNLVEYADSDSDLVLIGFAADGFKMYHSKSDAFEPSFGLVEEPRAGTGCTISLGPISENIDLGGTKPDGTYESDWEFIEGLGDLDQCNGITIDNQYIYLLTDEYPYIPRCLNGEFVESGPGGPQAR